MNNDANFIVELVCLFLLFLLLIFLDGKVNINKEKRHKQWIMPFVATIYTLIMLLFMSDISYSLVGKYEQVATQGTYFGDIYQNWGTYVELALYNLGCLSGFIVLKRIICLVSKAFKMKSGTSIGHLIENFYSYDEKENSWYVRDYCMQAKSFLKTAFYGGCIVFGIATLVAYILFTEQLIVMPFFPTFAILIIGELYYYIDGNYCEEGKGNLSVQTDKSTKIVMFPLLRKPLAALFGDKLLADGISVNESSIIGGSVEDILVDLERNGAHIGKNYAAFIRKKMENGLKPNLDYVRCGYDLATGKSLLFNTPFYDKLNPYMFYALNREILSGGKALIVLGRHGTEEDLLQWTLEGMENISNIPNLSKVEILTEKKINEEEMPDIGIISRSGVHNLEIHKNNKTFLEQVSFVIVVEPSRLVTTAQIGLNLLIKCCGKERKLTFCSVDRNCDGLVDALSHILMTNITEVSATEHPQGISTYICWNADDEYVQHRILPGVSRYLGMGTELSMVALRNQVESTIWYGGDAYPVKDARWIAKQYYYDLLDYAQLPASQDTFEKRFKTSFNMCDERVKDYSYITVEDDRNNLFETRRNYATIAQNQGFVNVISSTYLLRDYMAANPEIFTADPKAIPYLTADFARSKRNTILSLCLQLCMEAVEEELLNRQMIMLNIETEDPASVIWNEVCKIFSIGSKIDYKNNPILIVKDYNGNLIEFTKDSTLLFRREYSVKSARIENIYTIDNPQFVKIILEGLNHASYIAEHENEDAYIGTELKGHIHQKYLPGQFFTLNGKYYEMVRTTVGNRIIVRRAADHIDGRLAYRQIRKYNLHNIAKLDSMGSEKTINDIKVQFAYADYSVETPGYWKLKAYNDFDNGELVEVNGIPVREYRHKKILKLDFSKLGDAFTDSIRITLTNLLNETFVTLFADNQPFISAVTLGEYNAPLTYSLNVNENIKDSDKCIYIIEDSQLDIGLLIAVERNIRRIFHIISDYLNWNDEKIEESLNINEDIVEESENNKPKFNPYEENEIEEIEDSDTDKTDSNETKEEKKKSWLRRLIEKIKSFFKKEKKKEKIEETDDSKVSDENLIDKNEVKDEITEINNIESDLDEEYEESYDIETETDNVNEAEENCEEEHIVEQAEEQVEEIEVKENE